LDGWSITRVKLDLIRAMSHAYVAIAVFDRSLINRFDKSLITAAIEIALVVFHLMNLMLDWRMPNHFVDRIDFLSVIYQPLNDYWKTIHLSHITRCYAGFQIPRVSRCTLYRLIEARPRLFFFFSLSLRLAARSWRINGINVNRED